MILLINDIYRLSALPLLLMVPIVRLVRWLGMTHITHSPITLLRRLTICLGVERGLVLTVLVLNVGVVAFHLGL